MRCIAQHRRGISRTQGNHGWQRDGRYFQISRLSRIEKSNVDQARLKTPGFLPAEPARGCPGPRTFERDRAACRSRVRPILMPGSCST
jgi:hypothetical protein